MNRLVNFILEPSGPPPPKRKAPPPPPPAVYPLWEIKVGSAVRFPRSVHTLRKVVQKYLKTPEGAGKKFLVRAITPAMCRVWRVK